MVRVFACLGVLLLCSAPQAGRAAPFDVRAASTNGSILAPAAKALAAKSPAAGKTAEKPVAPEAAPAEEFDSSALQDGDIVLRRGRGLLSMLFSSVGPGDREFSHAGIFLRRDGRELIIHTVANQVTGKGAPKIEPLTKFIDKEHARSASVYRVKGLGEPTRKLFLETALGYVRDKVPFDDKFDLADASKLYCTELIYQALLTAGIAVVDSPHKLTAPVGGLLIGEVVTAGQIAMSERTEFILRLK